MSSVLTYSSTFLFFFLQSSHTQTNVFDAVQEYGDEGDDEAARYYGLDRYDPALLDSVTTAQGALGADETLWAYDGPQHHDPLTAMSQISGADAFSTLQGASPSFLGDYADEPSTAPTSRASEWRGEAGGSGSGGVVGGNNASNGGGGAFLPRNSPYGSSMHHTPKRRRDSPTQLSPHLSSANAAPGSHWNSRIVSAFQPHLSSSSSSSSSSRPVAGRAYRSNEPMVPSQPHPHPMSSDTHSRALLIAMIVVAFSAGFALQNASIRPKKQVRLNELLSLLCAMR